MVDAVVCNERHKRTDEQMHEYRVTLGEHGDRLDKLENSQIRTEVVVQNLCEQIKTLVDTMRTQQKEQIKVVIGTLCAIIGVFTAFFIWYIQTIPR